MSQYVSSRPVNVNHTVSPGIAWLTSELRRAYGKIEDSESEIRLKDLKIEELEMQNLRMSERMVELTESNLHMDAEIRRLKDQKVEQDKVLQKSREKFGRNSNEEHFRVLDEIQKKVADIVEKFVQERKEADEMHRKTSEDLERKIENLKDEIGNLKEREKHAQKTLEESKEEAVKHHQEYHKCPLGLPILAEGKQYSEMDSELDKKVSESKQKDQVELEESQKKESEQWVRNLARAYTRIKMMQ